MADFTPQGKYPTTPPTPGMVWMGNPDNTAWKQVSVKDVPEGKKNGYRVIQPNLASGLITRSPLAAIRGMAVTPQPLPDSTAQRMLSQTGSQMARGVVKYSPEMLSLIAASALPETKVAGWAARPIVAALTAAGATPVSQAVNGEQPTAEAAQNSALWAGGTQSIGEILRALFKVPGDALQIEGVSPSRTVRRQFPQIEQAIKSERIPVGGPNTTAGADEVARRAAENGRTMAAARSASTVTHSVDDVMQQVDKEIAHLRNSAHPEDKAAADALQASRDAFAAANPNGLTTEALDNAVRSSQQRATGTWVKDANGKLVSVQTTPEQQVYHRLFAKQGRLELRKVPGMAATKDRAAMLKALGKAYADAESAPPPKASTLADPTKTVQTMARRTFMRPDVASRMGLAMTDPAFLAALRQGPMAAMWLLGMSPGSQPDATRTGGQP